MNNNFLIKQSGAEQVVAKPAANLITRIGRYLFKPQGTSLGKVVRSEDKIVQALRNADGTISQGNHLISSTARPITDAFTLGQRATQLGAVTTAAGVPVGAYYAGKYMGGESTPTETEPATGPNKQQDEKTEGTPTAVKPGIYDKATKWISENPWTTALLGAAGIGGLGYLMMDDEDEDEEEDE